MKIRLDNNFEFDLPFGITSFVGGGGKTSSIEWIADCIPEKYKVIITTTTHIWKPYDALIDTTNEETFKKHFINNNIAFFGHLQDDGKITATIDEVLKVSKYADFILVEADGAKRHPIKIPSDREPVIPDDTKLVIGCVGLDCINRKVSDVLFRYDQVETFKHITNKEILSLDDVIEIVLSEKGLKKDIRSDIPFILFMNKYDALTEHELIKDIQLKISNQKYFIISALSRRVYFDSCN